MPVAIECSDGCGGGIVAVDPIGETLASAGLGAAGQAGKALLELPLRAIERPKTQDAHPPLWAAHGQQLSFGFQQHSPVFITRLSGGGFIDPATTGIAVNRATAGVDDLLQHR